MNTKLLAAAFAAACAASALADKVTLKSGSFLTGTAGEVAGDKLKFASDDLGDIEIAVEEHGAAEDALGIVGLTVAVHVLRDDDIDAAFLTERYFFRQFIERQHLLIGKHPRFINDIGIRRLCRKRKHKQQQEGGQDRCQGEPFQFSHRKPPTAK